ncbi:phytanoyl-CoA dioxygenase family protein [Nitzschia inconspicua]|uniref:Phytanoyl-CoA dioxygenase family protein n=1 Tax=Nitzschia inconspicua TaxID=303405 RepID=A0A9K3Q1Z2_9STRA|nr:phytanoyl-CoA dioxygenase family protein [Nitzschia inconspicua]
MVKKSKKKRNSRGDASMEDENDKKDLLLGTVSIADDMTSSSSSLLDSIFGSSGNKNSKPSTERDLFAKVSSLPKSRIKMSTAPSSHDDPDSKKRRIRPSRNDILQQRRRQSQHPLLASSMDFPGVFEREHDTLEELPWEEQVAEMAQSVLQHGLCIIRNPVDTGILQAIASQARVLQSRICRELDAKGISWKATKSNGFEPQTFRFQQAASRCKGRMDMAIGTDNSKTPSNRGENGTKMIDTFYQNTDIQQHILQNPKFYPVIRNLLGGAGSDDPEAVKLVYAGLIFNLPDSEDQPWHQDGVPLFPEARNTADMQASFPPYALNVFIPLETQDGSIERGPTEFLPGSHQWSAEQLEQVNNSSENADNSSDSPKAVSPILKQGDVLIYDYRVCHRGTSNLVSVKDDNKDVDTVQASRRILYLMYARPWFTDHINFDCTKNAESIWSTGLRKK